MNLKLLRSTLCLLAMSALFTDGAIAGDYAGCVKYTNENLNPSLISVRLGEQEAALADVSINAQGNLSKCTIVKGSGSERLDGASCDWVKDHWRSLDRCQNHCSAGGFGQCRGGAQVYPGYLFETKGRA